MMKHAHPCVSDQSREAVKTEGLDPKDESAVGEAETPNPHPLPTGTEDYTGLIERLFLLAERDLKRLRNDPDFVYGLDDLTTFQAAQALLSLQQERDDLDRRATEYALQANDQALTIASLQQKNKELEEERDAALEEADDAKIWPEWAQSILKVLERHGAVEPHDIGEDGVDLPQALADWMAGTDAEGAALRSQLTASQAECERLRGEVERKDKALEKIARRAKYDEPDVRDDLRRDLRHIKELARSALSPAQAGATE